MMRISLLLLVALLTTQSCSKKTGAITVGTQRCLNEKLVEFSQVACKSGATLKEYSFQDKTVFVFDPGHCGADMSSLVYDSECKELGYLGGFAGNTKINGEDFSKATYIKTLWSN